MHSHGEGHLRGRGGDGTVSVFGTASNTRLDALQVSAMPLGFCASNTDGSFIVTGSADMKLRVLRFDGAALKLDSSTSYESLLETVRFNSTRTRFVATMSETMGPPPMTKRQPIEAFEGKPVWLEGTRGPVRSAAWSVDDLTVFTGAEATGVTAWDTTTGKKKFDMPGHRGAVIGLVLSPDGRTLFSAGSDGTLRLWNAASGAALKTIQAHSGRITDVWQPHGSTVVVTLGIDGAINVWSLSGQLRKTLPSPSSGLMRAAADAATDQLVTISRDATMRSFQLSATDFEREVPVAPETALFAVSPDEKTLLTAVYAGPFSEHHLRTDRPSSELAATLVEDRFFVFAPNDLIATDRGGTIELIDRQNHPVKSFKAHPSGEATVDVSPDGKKLLANGGYAEPIIIDIESGTSHSPPETLKTATAFFSRKTPGSDVWFGSTTGEIVFWPAIGALRKKTISRALVTGLGESPDGEYLVAATYDQRLHVIRADTLEVTSTAASGIMPSSIAFSPDSKLVAVGAPSGDVQVWSLSPFEKVDARKVGAKLYQLASLRTDAQFITLTPDGLLVWAF